MKRIIIIMSIVSASIGLSAQQLDTTWVRQYDRTSANQQVSLSEIRNNKYLIHQAKNYYEINGSGDSIGGGILDTAMGQFGPNFLEAHNGHLYAGASKNSAPVVFKLDTSYNILWSTSLTVSSNFGTGVSAIMLDSGYIYASGSWASQIPFIAKLDSTGAVIWKKDYPQSSFSNLTHMIKLQDGSYLASGNRDDYPLAIKFNSVGDTAWTYTENIFISFRQAAAVEKANGNMVLAMRNKIIELDGTGARVDSAHTENEFMDIHRAGDTLYLFGLYKDPQSANNRYPYVETRNVNLDSTNSWRYSGSTHPTANNGFDDAIRTTTGGFISAGKHRDSVNVTANTYNLLAVRFNDSTTNINTSVHQLSKQLSAKQLYPNPANNKIFLSIDKVDKAMLTNLQGNAISLAVKNQQIETASITSGFYILHIKSGTNYYHGKVIIRH